MPKLPVQAPEAVHPVVFVEAQVSVAAPPTVTDVGDMLNVGAAGASRASAASAWMKP